MKCYRSILPGLAAILLGLQPVAEAQQGVPDETDALGRHFVNRIGRQLHHRGQPFRVAGANNYYPMYASQTMVNELFTTAAQHNFNVFRFWGFIDIGNQNGSNSEIGRAHV